MSLVILFAKPIGGTISLTSASEKAQKFLAVDVHKCLRLWWKMLKYCVKVKVSQGEQTYLQNLWYFRIFGIFSRNSLFIQS